MALLTEIVKPQNRKYLESILLRLQADTPAVWGKMVPQQMIEHLIDQVQYTNGKKIPYCEVSEEEADIAKQINIYSDTEISRNTVFTISPVQLLYPNLSVAILNLMAELRDFDRYFAQPKKTVIHGAFGPLTYEEWLIWHSKHFYHHLKQFDLIPT